MFCVKRLFVVHSSHPVETNQFVVFRKITSLRGENHLEQNTVHTDNIQVSTLT